MKIAAPSPLDKFLPSWLLSYWCYIRIHATTNAIPRLDKKAPVVLFSHGLTASRETSSSLAMTLAEIGCVVVMVEHTDKSSSLARFFDGGVIEYDKSIKALESTAGPEVMREERRKQTRIRIHNINSCLQLLREIDRCGCDSGVAIDCNDNRRDDILNAMRGNLKVDCVAVGGHSFGGASAIGAVLKSQTEKTSDYGWLFTLDPACQWVPREFWPGMGIENDAAWPFAKDDPWESSQINLLSNIPSYVLFSESWVKIKWFIKLWKRLLGNQAHQNMEIIAGGGHQSLCDLPVLLPRFLCVALGTLFGKAKEETSQTIVDRVNASIVDFLSRSNFLDQRPRSEN